MLGVSPESSSQDIKNAYFYLVKSWHPDRLPEPLSDLKPLVDTIFGLLSRAHETLSDETQRLEYSRVIKQGGGTPASERIVGAILEAALEYQKVEVLVRRRQFSEAISLLDRVIDINPEEADYYAMRAWLLFQQDHDGNQPLQAVLDAAQQALELNEAHDRAHYIKGLVLKRMGRTLEAL
jgi:curved DNA-binding protein CbpA